MYSSSARFSACPARWQMPAICVSQHGYPDSQFPLLNPDTCSKQVATHWLDTSFHGTIETDGQPQVDSLRGDHSVPWLCAKAVGLCSVSGEKEPQQGGPRIFPFPRPPVVLVFGLFLRQVSLRHPLQKNGVPIFSRGHGGRSEFLDAG